MADLPSWTVLILCVGRTTDVVRPELTNYLSELGFEAHVYDSMGYPADPSLDTVSACVEAIDQHDIVLALIDEEEGTEVNPKNLDPAIREYLVTNGLLPGPGSALPPPTVFQLEVLTAKARGKPTLALMTTAARDLHRQVIKMLSDGDIVVTRKEAERSSGGGSDQGSTMGGARRRLRGAQRRPRLVSPHAIRSRHREGRLGPLLQPHRPSRASDDDGRRSRNGPACVGAHRVRTSSSAPRARPSAAGLPVAARPVRRKAHPASTTQGAFGRYKLR